MDTGSVPIIAEASAGGLGFFVLLVVVIGVAFWKRDAIKSAVLKLKQKL